MNATPLSNQTLLVTGESPYLARHTFLFEALLPSFKALQVLERDQEWYEEKLPRLFLKYLYALRVFSKSKADTLYQKNQREFIAKSRRMERRIGELAGHPDLVLHIFNTFSPFWDHSETPYAVYLDYTMRLSAQKQLPWAFFLNQRDRDQWLACEQRLFQNARYLFCQSQVVAGSLIEDYGIEANKVVVVGASGNFQQPYQGEKTFGSQQLLFNGSDFQRKGGDLVLAAFEKVRQALPEAKLVVIGRKLMTQHPGVINPGPVSASELRDLFLQTDLVVSPAYSDPFPRFVMEAMNYGVPCVVSNQDGMPEIVEQGRSGIVVNQPDPESLANTLIGLLTQPEQLKLISQAARDRIRTQLNWDAVAQKMVTALSEQESLIDESVAIAR